MNPLVSVVIPARDAEAFVADAVRSVMGQTYRPLECIVVDDGSTDATASVVSRLSGVTLLRHEQARGVSAARNTGVHASTGSYLAFLDADDGWAPEKLTRQVAALTAAPRTGILMSGYQHVDASMRRTLGVMMGDGSMNRIVSWLCLEGTDRRSPPPPSFAGRPSMPWAASTRTSPS